jgi:hypothetical protein
MAEALVEAARDRWTTTDELLVMVAQGVRMLWRQQVVNAGGEDPGELEISRPGDPPKKKRSSIREAARRAMGAGRGR